MEQRAGDWETVDHLLRAPGGRRAGPEHGGDGHPRG
jgi:hypothetical protein